MNILFRADSSSTIGLGHLMRCLVLAEQYPTANISFACQDLVKNANYKITDAGYSLHLLNDHSIETLVKLIQKLAIYFIIFDHYDIDAAFEKSIKTQTGVKILSFDDTYEPHYCDILLNHNIYAKKERYKNLTPHFCELRCGREYTLIRDEFKKIKPKKRQINKKNPTVFVALGGVDTSNISLSVLKTLIEFDNITIHLATTSANPNIPILQAFANKYADVNIYVDYNIAILMDKSDFAIVTPSVIVYEVIFLNLPFIAIKTAENQKILYQYLHDNKYPILKKYEFYQLLKLLKLYVK